MSVIVNYSSNSLVALYRNSSFANIKTVAFKDLKEFFNQMSNTQAIALPKTLYGNLYPLSLESRWGEENDLSEFIFSMLDAVFIWRFRKKISSVSCWGVFMTIKTSGLLSGLQFHIKTMDTDQSSVTNSISVWNIVSVTRFIILQFFAENLFGN